jgi:hypothetical protein
MPDKARATKGGSDEDLWVLNVIPSPNPGKHYLLTKTECVLSKVTTDYKPMSSFTVQSFLTLNPRKRGRFNTCPLRI